MADLRKARPRMTEHQSEKEASELLMVLFALGTMVVVYLTTIVVEFIWNGLKDIKNEM